MLLPFVKLPPATGANVRRLTLPGAERAHCLRTFDDALDLRAALRPGRHDAIVGDGFAGLELAASAIERGCKVAVLDAAPRLPMRGVPAEIAAAWQAHFSLRTIWPASVTCPACWRGNMSAGLDEVRRSGSLSI